MDFSIYMVAVGRDWVVGWEGFAGVGGEGVLWVRGDSNAPCYWNRPEKTAETMRDGWIWTGDRLSWMKMVSISSWDGPTI